MADLKQYIPTDYSWWQVYASRMGEKELENYYDRVFMYLVEMKPRTSFNILLEVKPANYDLFVKCLYRAYRELTFCNTKENNYAYNYSIENNFTEVWRW